MLQNEVNRIRGLWGKKDTEYAQLKSANQELGLKVEKFHRIFEAALKEAFK
jgi:hypothetical protein